MSDYTVVDNRIEKKLPLFSHGINQTQTVAEFNTRGQANVVCNLMNEVALLRAQVKMLMNLYNIE